MSSRTNQRHDHLRIYAYLLWRFSDGKKFQPVVTVMLPRSRSIGAHKLKCREA